MVGYHTLGHCFFLEDGNEQRNTFRHNLGLVSLPGTLLPSDRDQYMCETLLAGVHGNYTPVAESECMSVALHFVFLYIHVLILTLALFLSVTYWRQFVDYYTVFLAF